MTQFPQNRQSSLTMNISRSTATVVVPTWDKQPRRRRAHA